jgi:hypothetical protein
MRRFARAFPYAMNPYRLAREAIARTGRARLRRVRGLTRAVPVLAGALVFFSGWALGRQGTRVEVQVPPPTALPERDPTPEREPQQEAAPVTEVTPKRYSIGTVQARATIAARARAVISAIARRDARALATFVDPDERIVLSDFDGDDQLELSPVELSACPSDPTPRLLGEETVTCAELWKAHLTADFAHGMVDYNTSSPFGRPGRGGPGDPMMKAHPDSIVVQYVARRPDHDEKLDTPGCTELHGWSTLRLVFDARGTEWRLAALAWRDWSSGGCNGAE